MPVVEHSGMRLEYPAGDEQSIGTDGAIKLRAHVIPPHVNNRVWFAYRIDDGQWIRRQATREFASAAEEQYSLAVDMSKGRVGLRYLAFVRRGGITVPRGADTTSPDGDRSLKELTVYVSLTHDNAASRQPRSSEERSHDSGAGLPSDATHAKPRADAKPPVASPRGTPVTAGKESPSLERRLVEVEQPVFPVKAAAEHRRAKTFEYARLAQLDDDTAGKLAERDLRPDDIDDATLANMVTEGLLSDQQKTDLQLTLELGKLTGDNFSFVSAMKSRGFKSVADLTGWEKTDWHQLIVGDKLPLPPGETAESYAEHILFNVERTYPSQSLFTRLLSPKQTTRLSLLNSLGPLLDKNDRLINGENPAALDWTGVEANQRQAAEQALQELTAFANTYRHLGLAELVNNKALALDQKKGAIAGRLQLLDTFYQNNPALDLRLVNFFDKSDGKLNWSTIPAADRPLVRKQLMAYQRVLNLADDTAGRQMLLSKGYDSAMAIAATTESEFVRTSDLSRGQARMIYAKAQEDTLFVAHSFEAMRDVVRGQYKDIASNNLDPQLINDLREIDGFDDLFGPQDFCDCEHCRSIVSPAAYFVDLMYFIEDYVSREIFKGRRKDHPLYLKKRRGDLWTLKLTCENTHTQIPYLTIVNEVLEAYLENNRRVSGDIFEALSIQKSDAEKVSFGLPFNLPLEELRLYLSHFNITLHDIYRILKQPETKIWRARLNLSTEEFGVIIKPDPNGVTFRFGSPASLADFPVNDYRNKKRELRGFIKFAGITRLQLDELLNLRFKRFDRDPFNLNPPVGNIEVAKVPVADELQNFTEILKNLTNNHLDFIHRFIRLWRKAAWSIPDLDLILIALQKATLIGPDLNHDAVILLAQLVDIQEKLKLTVDELCSLVDELPVSREFPLPPSKQAARRLYERLFDLKKLFGEKDPETHELNTSAVYHHYSRNTNNSNDREIDPKTPLLLGGLGVSETELLLLFDLLKADMPFDADGDTKDAQGKPTFDRRRISLLYRHARLARALKLSIEDFIEALRLNFAPDNLVITTLEQIHQLMEFEKWLKTSPFSVSELRFILKGEETSTVGYKTNLEMVGTIVREVQASQVWNEVTPDTAVGIVREVQRSQVTDKTAGLKDALGRFFHLTSERMAEILNLAGSDLDSAGIQTALNVRLTDGVNPVDLNALRDVINEIVQALKIEALKTSLAKSFNLAANQLGDTLQWVSTDINSAGVQTALNATFIKGDPNTAPPTEDHPQNPDDLNALLDLMQEIERVLSIFSHLKFKAESVAYLTEKPATLGIADLKNLTLDNLKALTVYKKLIALSEEAEPMVQEVLDSYLGAPTAFYVDDRVRDDVARLADLWQQDRSLIKSLINSLTLPEVPIAALEYLWEGLNLCQTLGVNGYSLQKLANDASFAAITAARDVALGAFSSKYDDEKVRQEKIEPYQDKINVMKRDALGDYIIARQQELKFKDKNDLYAFFLLDAEMSGCFRTSRVVCAISNLQLYVHRILMNLEQSASDDLVVLSQVTEIERFRQEWEWRKNYRVWEANRKVFLYPENYTEPDLRDNKTHIFKELEDELLQEKITKESAEFAYRKYVAGLTELAKLRIVGSYYRTDPDPPQSRERDIYYLFGRTHTNPYQYYYRTLIRKAASSDLSGTEEDSVWGNWVKMELAIEAAEISSLVFMGRLYVFWTQVERREITNIKEGDPTSVGYVFKVYAKYSYLDEHGKWSAPQKVYVGYRPIIEKTIFARAGLPETATDAQKTGAVEDFQEEVFRKPYPICQRENPAAPIRLYFIWSDEKSVQTSEVAGEGMTCYKTEEYWGVVTYALPPASTGSRSGDGGTSIPEREPKTAGFHLPSYVINVVDGDFPVEKPVDWELDGVTQSNRGTLRLFGPSQCTIEVNFLNPIGGGTGEDKNILRIPVPVRPCDSTTGPAVDSPYLPSVSRHDLSLATTAIKDVGEIKLEEITSAEFLRAEYKKYDEEKKEDVQAGYVQDGTSHFTDTGKGRIVSQSTNDSKLEIPGQATILLSTFLVDDLSQRIFAEGITEFLSLDTQCLPADSQGKLDFEGPYGTYYQELFFHIPFLIAHHLNANQKFKEAKWWYERIFDPTASELPDDQNPTNRNWRYIKFRDPTIEKMKAILVNGAAIERYKDDPFNPHAIASLRLNAYQKAIVMKYIDNLLDWGDYLFAQDTQESINEATMLYVLATDILGRRPVQLGKCETAQDEDLTYKAIGPKIKEGSEFLITLENWHASNRVIRKTLEYRMTETSNSGSRTTEVALTGVSGRTDRHAMRISAANGTDHTGIKLRYTVAPYAIGINAKTEYEEKVKDWEAAKPTEDIPHIELVKQSTLAFCVPPNYDLLAYWDRVEDRLFKIRHCRNISGVRRQLALFQPPINPALLVRARAAGLSLEDILAMLSAPLPPYRFSYLIEKAKQFTQTVQSFGSALLSALEKKDVEELTLLRSVHERNILRMTKEIKKQQLTEAQYQHQSMVETKTNVQNRLDYYQGLVDEGLTDWEITQQVSKHIGTAHRIVESVFHIAEAVTALVPQAGSPFSINYGGKQISKNFAGWANWTQTVASIANEISASAGLEATFQRREQEWKQQLSLAQQELKQVEQQRLAAEVRQLIAEKDLEIHETNMEQADELHEFYKDKFTNLGLYNYLSTTLNRLYREAYSMAYDLAKMAERTYQFERDDETIFIAADNWQFDRAGLLAGERLLLQLQRLEKAYLEQHTRDYEMTQSFSLALLNPSALLTLKQTGSCEFDIPEIMFDLFYPGQYKRVIKSVRLSIPCVTGPYTNISAKLSLVDSDVRKEASLDNTAFIPIPNSKLTTTSIATSNAQNDSGLFELNFRDERYLPFEGAGAISSWRLELPSKLRLFDYDTISDVIIHISYTAKDDGVFKDTVEGQVTNALTDNGLYRLLSLRHEFPNAFHQLLNPTPGSAQSTEFEITERHFPYFLIDKAQQLRLSQDPTTVYLKLKAKEPVDITGLTMSINDIPVSGWRGFPVTSDDATTETDLMSGEVTLSGNPITIRPWTIDAGMDGLNKEKLEDILILLKYSID